MHDTVACVDARLPQAQAAAKRSCRLLLGRIGVFKFFCLAFVIESEFKQAAAKFSIEYLPGKLTKPRCLFSERLAEGLDIQVHMVDHETPRIAK
jgi:hypothetical protein